MGLNILDLFNPLLLSLLMLRLSHIWPEGTPSDCLLSTFDVTQWFCAFLTEMIRKLSCEGFILHLLPHITISYFSKVVPFF